MAALRSGSSGVETERDVIKLDANFHDAELTIGMYDYIIGTLPLPVRMLASITGTHGSKRRGIQTLERVAKKGQWTREDAKVLLIAIYKKEKRFPEALALSQETESVIGEALAERAIGRAIAASGENQAEALPHIKKSLEICENIGARFEIVRGLLAKGEALPACDNRAEAAKTLTQAQAMARECQLEREESIALALMARIDKATP